MRARSVQSMDVVRLGLRGQRKARTRDDAQHKKAPRKVLKSRFRLALMVEVKQKTPPTNRNRRLVTD